MKVIDRGFGVLIVCFMVTVTSIAQDESPLPEHDGALLEGYRSVQLALAKDQFEVAGSNAVSLMKVSQDWLDEAGAGNPQVEHVKAILDGTERVSEAKAEGEYRVAFSLVSRGMVEFIRHQVALQANWNLYLCSMFSGYGYWVQPKSDSKKMNPYKGLGMQQCGTLKSW